MKLFDLPYEVFADIISRLSAIDIIRLRLVSSRAHAALTRPDLSITLILALFPRSLEGRLLREHISSSSNDVLGSRDWSLVFTRLARRYFHLSTATPRQTLKLDTLKNTDRIRGVNPWNRFLRLDDRTAPFHYREPSWTFDAKEGLLVYPAPDGLGYQARDVETGEQVAVPFELEGKVVRRVRLCQGVLVLEWCEATGYHALNEREYAHRHFATAFDVRRRGAWDGALPIKGETALSLWDIRFRSEWKIHYLGLPLSANDRFYSTHNATHYVVYIWQPMRSPWGEDDPLERLIVWEIGKASAYRPSRDPGDKCRPAEDSGGPRVIHKLINHELAQWGVRQSDTPSLRALYLDDCTWDENTNSACGHVFFHEEEHRWSAGPHSNPDPPRLHTVKSTGVPISGEGPRWVDDCGESDPTMSFCWRGPRRGSGGEGRAEEAWPGRAPCWRHDDFPYLTVSEAYDPIAGVRFTARHCFMLETLSVLVRPKLRVAGVGWGGGVDEAGDGPHGDEVQFGDAWWEELLGKGYLVGDERWVVGEDQEGDITVIKF